MAGGTRARGKVWAITGSLLATISGLLVVRLWLGGTTPPLSGSEAASPAPTPAGTRLEATLPPVPSSVAQATVAGMIVPPVPSVTPPAASRAQRVGPEDFGGLPPLAWPGDGGLGTRPILTYERAADLGTPPAAADVYELTWPIFNPEAIGDLGRRLGLNGTVETLGPGAYQVQESGSRLFVAHGRIVYSRPPGGPVTGMPDPTRAAEQARAWLAARQLLPADAGRPQTRPLAEAGLVVVTLTPLVPAPLITPEPSLAVTLDAAGMVREVDALWPATQRVSAYPLSSLGAAWEAARRGDGFVEMEAGVPEGSAIRLTGQVQVTRVSIGYALAGGGDAAGASFLQPVYIFAGSAQIAGLPAPLLCRIYVPALRDYRWPRG